METADFFAKYTRAYDRIMTNLTFYQDLIRLHREALQGRQRVLESGCGPGALALKLLEWGVEVHALDQNQVALDLLKERRGALGGKLSTYCRDACDLSIFSDGFFDGVSSMLVLMFMSDPIQYLKEHVRVLNKGGVFVVSGADLQSKEDVNLLISAWKQDHENQGVLKDLEKDWELLECYTRQNADLNVKHWFSLEELARILEKDVGLQVIKKVTNPIYFGKGYVITAMKS